MPVQQSATLRRKEILKEETARKIARTCLRLTWRNAGFVLGSPWLLALALAVFDMLARPANSAFMAAFYVPAEHAWTLLALLVIGVMLPLVRQLPPALLYDE